MKSKSPPLAGRTTANLFVHPPSHPPRQAGTPEQFDIRVRPALDSPAAAVDRIKMFIYENFAEKGLPCPVTGHPPTIGVGRVAASAAAGGARQQQQQQPSSG